VLVWDNLPAHRSKVVRRYAVENRHWLKLVYLPAYSPELNPVELLWDYLDDTELANTPVEDLKEIGRRLRRGIQRIGRHPQKALGFLRHTDLF
jgi:transposase